MDDELRERREETWRLYVEMGVSFTETAARIADQFDEKQTTIKTDISRMSDWLPKLDEGDLFNSHSRLREIRSARQRQRQYEMMAQREEDYEAASRIATRITKNVRVEREMCEALGIISEEPTDFELAQDLDPEDEALLDEWAGVGEPLELEDLG